MGVSAFELDSSNHILTMPSHDIGICTSIRDGINQVGYGLSCRCFPLSNLLMKFGLQCKGGLICSGATALNTSDTTAKEK